MLSVREQGKIAFVLSMEALLSRKQPVCQPRLTALGLARIWGKGKKP